MRRPVDPRYPISGDTEAHARRGVGPATDYACPMRTAVLAPFTGRLYWYSNGPGGKGVRLVGTHATFYGQHLDSRRPAGGFRYSEGSRIAWSGNTGTATDGPHLHCYVVINATGVRMSMAEYLAEYAPTRNPTPYPAATAADPLEDDMARTFARAKKDTKVYEISDGKKRHVLPAEWRAITDAYARAGVKLPYSQDRLTIAQLNTIPTAK